MAESPMGNSLVIFQIVLIALTNVQTGKCLDILGSVIGERNVTTGDFMKYITWNVNSTGIGFNSRESTELVKVNDTAEWPLRSETVSEKMSNAGKKVKGFFDNLKSDLFGGRRRKRSAVIHDDMYIGRNAKFWRTHMDGYRRSDGAGYERQYRDTMIRRLGSPRWYNWPKARHEIAGEQHGFIHMKNGRQALVNYDPHHYPGYDAFSRMRMRNRLAPRMKVSYDPTTQSVKIFKEMKSRLMSKTEEEEEVAQQEIPDSMQISAGVRNYQGPQFKCKAGTKGAFAYVEGRTAGSKGLAFSQEDDQGVRTLLCKAETSDVSQIDNEVFLKNSVTGINAVTNDRDPFKFLERGNEIDDETLEVGSRSESELSYLSEKNQSVSSVNTQDRGAHSLTKVNTKFMYENGYRTAFESSADIEGSTTFNLTNGQLPLTVTSRKEETSSIFQNPEKFGVQLPDKGQVATFMNYKKKIDFDIAFRNLFDQ